MRTSEAIIIAPPSQRAVLAALVDLSAAGLVAPFQWLESQPGEGSEQSLTMPVLLRVEDGAVRAVNYHDVVNRHGLSKVRTVVVVPLGHNAGDSLSAETELRYLNLPVAHGAQRQPIRVLVPWSARALPAVVGHAGWHNVMLSPETTADPGFAPRPWWDVPDQMPGAIALGIAAQAGIAGAVESAPVDEVASASGSSVSVVRTFIRHVDAYEAEGQLRTMALGVTDSLPQPVRADGSRSYIAPFADPVARIQTVANAWYHRHESTLRRAEAPAPTSEQQEIGAWQALRMFFSFMFKAVLGAPGAWLRNQVHGMKASIAAGVGDFVFGQGSAMTVLVDGVDASGHTAGWRDIAAAARELSASVPTVAGERGPAYRPSLAPLWQDLVAGTQALADGSGCEALGLARHEGYVSSRDLIAPPHDAGADFVLPIQVGPYPAGHVLHSWDDLEIKQVLTVLGEMQQGEQGRADASRAVADIQRWQQEGQHRLLQTLGRFLSYRLSQTQEDIRRYRRTLDDLRGQDVDSQVESRQGRLAKFLRIFLVVFLVALVVIFALHIWKEQRFDWLFVVLAWLLSFIIWAGASMATFFVQQRELFRILHLMRSRESLVPVAEANLRVAIEDLAVQGEAYAQFDHWCRILTAFLANPLGDQVQAKRGVMADVVMPAGFSNVRATASQQAIADTAAVLRAQVFTVGWVKEAWHHLEQSMAEDLSPDERARMQARELHIFSEPGSTASALTHWSSGLQAHGVRSRVAEVEWQRCLQMLEQDWATQSLALGVASGTDSRSLSEFRDDLRLFRGSSVVTDVFAPGRFAGMEAQTVAQGHWFREQRDGLSTTMVLTDSTAPLTSDYFVYPAPAQQTARFDAAGPLY